MHEKLKHIQHLIISDPNANAWRKQVEFRRANKDWLLKSARIAIKILRTLREKKMTQVQLAELLAVSPQHINKILKGQENLTLETIGKLEAALGIELITIIKSDEKVVKSDEWSEMVVQSFSSRINNIQQLGTIKPKCKENIYSLAS
jgi:transcriptional regulator with XRE-family HTH domain